MMKKWTAALLACMMMCILSFGAMAECLESVVPEGYRTVYFEGFEGDNGFDQYDFDGDGYQWGWYDEDESFKACHGSWFMFSESWESEPLNMLLLPVMDIPENAKMTFSTRVASADRPNENFGVFYATSEDDYDAFNQIEYFELNENNTKWTSYTIDLAEYAGDDVQLAFYHYNTVDMDMLFLDCVHIWAPDSKTAASLPQTGDNSNIALWIGLMAISFLGAAALSRKAKKAC